MKRNKPLQKHNSGFYIKTKTHATEDEQVYLNGKRLTHIYIGIDPGSSSGGMAFVGNIRYAPIRFKDITEKELCLRIKEFTRSPFRVYAILERAQPMPGQGISSTSKFMDNYGMLRGFLMALDIPFKIIRPQVWQKHYSMKKRKGETQTAWKQRLRQRAQELYPNIKITAETADALLIANYCMETWNVRS